MTKNELRLIKSALRPFVEYGLISEKTMEQIAAVKDEDGKTLRPELLTRSEVCEMLKVSTQSLINWANEGKLPEIKLAGVRCVRYRLEDVLALLK